jgi:mannose-6-phosphate isomerase-like protein (cupin superfamily)
MTPHGAEVPALFIEAPAELQAKRTTTDDLNRPLHQHPSARAAVIIEGDATFIFEAGRSQAMSIPVSAGDLLFWPAGVAHTFDAGLGFSLLSVLGSREGASRDGYATPVPEPLALGPSRRVTPENIKCLRSPFPPM